ncbi:MAG: hypothetical protein ACSLFP_03890 [Acidimicrobiales bacterium]
MRRAAGAIGLVVVVLVVGVVAVPRPDGRVPVSEPVDRLLVVSMPGVSWADVESGRLPQLRRFVSSAAIGDISTRIGRRRASTTDAYLTMGAGTRSLAPDVEVAVALDPDETYGGVRTADILQRRLGEVPDGVAYLAAGAARDVNENSLFGGVPGRLGDLLAEAGIERAVVANADAAEGFVSDEPPPDGSYARGAATTLMGADGIVPGGTVARDLLIDDPLGPFGRRLDPEAVLAAFDVEWEGADRLVAMVETSDLSRAAGYAPRSTPEQRRSLRDDALARSDALLGELLARTDPSRDAVLVVSPVSRSASPELAVAALRTPEVTSGVLRSPTTRRDGYVQLADVAPTVLEVMGEEPPDDIEGRAFRVSPRPRGGDRVSELAQEADAAGFRDSLMGVVVPIIIVVLALLALATVLADRLDERLRAALRPAAFLALGLVPATFVVAQLPAVTGSTLGYAVALVALAVVAALPAVVVEHRRPGLGLLVACGLIVGLVVVDVLAGAPLQVNAVFGYSVAVAGRFAGLGNLAFALFGAAAVVLGVLIVDRWGQRALPIVLALFVGVVLVEGLPMLGADVGGVLSMVPAFGVTLLLLAGRRPTARDAAGLVAAAGLAVLAFAFVDGARPSGQQTHLARLAEHLVGGRFSAFADTLSRRLQASFGGADLAVWGLVVALIVGVAIYSALVARGLLGPRHRSRTDPYRPWEAAAAGLAVLAVVGLVANDSSIAVPATMLIVVVPALILRSAALPPVGAAGGEPA